MLTLWVRQVPRLRWSRASSIVGIKASFMAFTSACCQGTFHSCMEPAGASKPFAEALCFEKLFAEREGALG